MIQEKARNGTRPAEKAFQVGGKVLACRRGGGSRNGGGGGGGGSSYIRKIRTLLMNRFNSGEKKTPKL